VLELERKLEKLKAQYVDELQRKKQLQELKSKLAVKALNNVQI